MLYVGNLGYSGQLAAEFSHHVAGNARMSVHLNDSKQLQRTPRKQYGHF